MELFWNLTASAGMLLFLALLAQRGLAELGWLPHGKTRGAHENAKTTCAGGRMAAPAARELLAWAVLAAAVQWLALALGWYLAGTGRPLTEWLRMRMVQAGDAPHYLYLAQYGYARSGEMVNRIVFYPLYPLVVRVVWLFTGDIELAGLAVSQCCWAAAAAVLRRFAARVTASPAQARCAVLAMILFPFSFFSQGVFTESLFLLLTLASLDAAFAQRWRAAGIWGFLAALCRTQGMLLVFPLVFAWLAARKTAAAPPRRSFFWACCPPAGFGVYLWLNVLYCGSPAAFCHYQSIAPWYQSVQWVGNTVAQQWRMALAYPGLSHFIYAPQLILYYLVLALLLLSLAHGAPTALLLYGGAYLGLCYLQGWMISGSRYLFGCAALYPLVGRLPGRALRAVILLTEGALLILYAAYFMQGQSIM